MNRRFLALWFPFLPADRLRWQRAQAGGSLPEAPFAFVEKAQNVLRITAVDQSAISLGLISGLTLADARSRVPELAIFDTAPQADQDWLERLADGCDRYTPMVAIDAPDGLLLDITGCVHLFKGETTLAQEIEHRLSRLGITSRSALASSPDAAHALARFQSLPAHDETAAIRRLPIAALRLDTEVETALRRMGLKCIADLVDRPSAPLAARFGADVPARLARLLAQESRPLSPRRPAPMLITERRFAEPIANTGFALKCLTELVGEAAAQMEEVHRGGRCFEARFFRTDGLVHVLRVETSLPIRDPAVVIRLIRERIDSLSDPLDPGFGFDLVRLSVPVTEVLAPDQLQLDGGSVAEAEIAALIDRLSTRLGRNRVSRLGSRNTHIPEQSCLMLPATQAVRQREWAKPEPGEPPMRPLHLFDPPQRIEMVTAEVPDGPPRRFRWHRNLHEVTLYEGPERIAHEWWRRDDGQGLTRDYYRVEDMRGRRFWIFRHGLYGHEKASPDWYIHGLFA
jgi:protein ImuB